MKIFFTTSCLLILCLLFGNGLYAQCNGDDCGEMSANVGPCSGFSNVICEDEAFCISVSAIELSGLPLANPDSIRIDWGDGTSQLEIAAGNFNHVYSFTEAELTPGGACVGNNGVSRQINVTLYEDCPAGTSCLTIATFITVEYLPIARIIAPDTICVSDQFCIGSQTCFADSVIFDFGDGNGPVTNNCQTFTGPGVYNVSLIAFNDCGIDSAFATVHVFQAPDALIGVPPDLQDGIGCTGFYTFDNLSDTLNFDNDYYIWEVLFNGSPQGTPDTAYFLDDFTYFFANPGDYEVVLSAHNPYCPDAVDVVTFELIDAPNVQLNLSDVCESDQTSIDIDGTNGLVNFSGDLSSSTYEWSLNNTPISTSQFPGVLNLNQGPNLVEITITSPCGSNTTDGSVNLDTVILAQAGLDFDICDGDTCRTLFPGPTGGTWSGMGVQNNMEFCPTPLSPGNFTLTYTYVNGACSDSDDLTATIIPQPTVDAGADQTFCETDTSITLPASPPGGSWRESGLPFPMPFDAADIGGGNTATLTYIYTDPSTGCPNSDDVDISIDGLSAINLGDTIVCNVPTDIDLESLFSIVEGNENEVTWQGPGIVSSQSGLFNSNQNGATGAGIYDIEVTLSLNTCSFTDTISLEVIDGPVSDAGVDTTVCIIEGSYALTGNPSGLGVWAGPGVDPSTGIIDLAIAMGGNHQYTYTIFPGESCEASDQVMVEVIDVGVSAGPDQDVCESTLTYQLMGFSPSGGIWTGPALIDSTAGVIDIQLLQTDSCYTFTYTIDSQSANNCAFSDDMMLCVQSDPVSDFAIDGTACVGEDINFTNNSTGASTYQWGFGDTGTSMDFEPVYVYTDTGFYTIRLIAISALNCQDTSQLSIYITQPPTATSFDMSTHEDCAPVYVNFTNTSAGDGLSYFWDFGNGETSTEVHPDSIYFPYGQFDTTYYITLNVSNLCASIDVMDSVLVHPLPVANFGTDFNSYCSGQTVNIANASFGMPETYEWDYGNGTSSNGQTPINQVYLTGNAPDTFQIRLIAGNFCGVDTLVQPVIIEPSDVVAFFNTSDTVVCLGDTICFTSFATVGSGISYTFGDGNGTNEQNPCYVYGDAGFYEVVQYATGCGFDSTTVNIEVQPGPDVDFDHIPAVCPGAPVSFQNISLGVSGFTWDFGDSSGTSTLTHPEYIYSNAGDYTVSLTGVDQNGCRSTSTSQMMVYQPPVAQFNYTDSVCVDEPIGFISNSLGDITSCVWDFGEGDTIQTCTATHSFAGVGNFDVELHVTDSHGCVDSTSNEVFVRPQNFIHILIDDVTIILGQTVDLSTSFFATDPTFFWFPPDYLSCTDCPNPTATPFRNITYTVTMEDEFGCQQSDSVAVEVIIDRGIYFPNAFTPNGDGINDLYSVFADAGVAQIKRLRIFDRWGEMVHQMDNFQPNDPEIGWDGKLHGREMNPAVFVYKAEVEFIDGYTEIFTGDVTLIR